MRTRSALSGGGVSAAGSSSLSAASAATESRRELRPRRQTDQPAEIRGAPLGATPKPHAAAPRSGRRVTRGLAATLADNSEGSSSDENFDTSPPQTPTRSITRANRPRRLVGLSRASTASSAQNSRTRNSRLGKRARPQSGFYDEDSDQEDDDLDLDQDEDNVFLSPSPEESRQLTLVNRTKPASPKTPKHKKAKLVRSPGREKVNASRASTLPPGEGQSTVSEIIPNWLALDYFIWVQIFEDSAASLDDRDAAVGWLLATGRICKMFAEPAITALYRCPALLSRPMAHKLLALLAQDPSTTLFNYRAKVEKLRIDVGIIAKTYKGQHLDFGALVSYLPRLKVIDFQHTADDPPYRRLKENLKWHYPNALFAALNNTQESDPESVVQRQPTKLIGWRWNSRMMGTESDQEPLHWLRSLHLTPCFASLRKLSFVNFQVPSLDSRLGVDDDPEVLAKDLEFLQKIADAITALPQLEYLSMESSTVVNGHFLPLLPETLKTLELVNCWDINGEDFSSYLLTHGHRLEHLYLKHNQSLSLAFLTVLGNACPILKTLHMDLKTFNHHEFYNDSDPSYDQLLAVDQVPHWPTSLEDLQLKNMRKWEADGAEVLFQSLVDSAPMLPNLRYLDLKAMLDIPFRQRSQLRDKWEARMKKVFLRKLEDPLPLRSLRPPKPIHDAKSSPKARKSKKCATVESPSRRSGRIATQMSNPSSRASSMGRGLRKSSQGRPSYAEPDTDEDELDLADNDNADAESSNDGMTPEKKSVVSTPGSPWENFFHHGMCEKVEIQLDNQKPTERTLTMDDFLDDEVSDNPSDEDWDGDQDMDTGYAW